MTDIRKLSATTRCYGIVGTARGGPAYCGYRAKDVDANGRPCCGIHLGKMLTVSWYGNRYRYPEGIGGRWRFAHGTQPEDR